MARLTERDVLRIRELAARRTPQRIIARQYGVSRVAISHIVNRKTWAHMSG